MKTSVKHLSVAMSLALASAGFSAHVNASGFALIENSASGMGNAFAGGSAIADDASTVYFNPAGMTRLDGTQIVIAGHIVSPSAEFTDTGSTAFTTAPLTGSNDTTDETAFVPNFYYVTNIGNDSQFGLGITVPFGLATEYSDDWIGRYTATKSEVETININPSFSTKATDKLSLGFGLNIQYIKATLANQLDSGGICVNLQMQGGADAATAISNCQGAGLAVADAAVDSSQSLSGDDWSTGFNFGVLYDLDDASRIGFAYRSGIKHSLEGDVDFTMNATLAGIVSGLTPPANSLFSDTGVTAGIELPKTISVSYYRDVNNEIAVMADITWTEWNNFSDLTVVFDNPVQGSTSIPENWNNTMRYSVGMNYRPDSTMVYRFGIAYDETPVPSAEERTPRIPGNDRTWLSLGLGYEVSSTMSFDVGYSHLFVDDTEIHNTDATFSHVLNGTYEADINIFSVQGNFKF